MDAGRFVGWWFLVLGARKLVLGSNTDVLFYPRMGSKIRIIRVDIFINSFVVRGFTSLHLQRIKRHGRLLDPFTILFWALEVNGY